MSRTYLSHFCKERKRTVSHSKKRGKRIGALLFRYMEIIGELYRMDGELIHRYKAKQAGIVLYHCVRSKGRRQFGGNRKIRKPLAAEGSGRDAMTNKDYPDPEKRFMYL